MASSLGWFCDDLGLWDGVGIRMAWGFGSWGMVLGLGWLSALGWLGGSWDDLGLGAGFKAAGPWKVPQTEPPILDSNAIVWYSRNCYRRIWYST